MSASAQLRTGLDAVTNDRVPLREHVARIERLAEEAPHRIEALPTSLRAGFNCFAYAFDLFDEADYVRIVIAEQRAGGNTFFANSRFAEYLVSIGAVHPICRRDLEARDIALYGNRTQPRHAARITGGDRLVSKWGLGHLYRHGLWEVPARYGHTVRFVRPTRSSGYLPEFHAYLEATPEWPAFAAHHFPEPHQTPNGTGRPCP